MERNELDALHALHTRVYGSIGQNTSYTKEYYGSQNHIVNSSTDLLQYAVRLLVDDLAAPSAVLQLLIATGGTCLLVAVHDAFV